MVSIQISLNGLSFYDTKRSKTWQSSTITIDQSTQEQTAKLRKLSNSAQVVISTDNFVMVPSDLFLDQDTELYFTAKLLPYSTEQFQYIKATSKDIVFIMAIELDLAALFLATFTTLVFTHPLLQTVENITSIGSSDGIHIHQADKRCAISIISNNKLIFSDYLKIASELDIVYYLKKLITDNNIHTSTIYCLGTNRKQTAEGLAPYFNKIKYSE